MKLKINLLWFFVLIGIVAVGAQADGLQWQLPGGIGTVQLPSTGYDILPLVGYDFLQRQEIAGAATSVLTLFREVNGYVGAVGEFHSQAPNIQPYLALGADVKKYIPVLSQFQSLQVHGFGRWDTASGGSFEAHLGAGLAVAYKFGGAS